MEHQYSRFKNKNIPYAKVGRRVFESLFNTEKFCSEHGLDVNCSIEYGENQELKAKVQEIAKCQKAILREVHNQLEKKRAGLHNEINGFSGLLNGCHPLDQSYLEHRRDEAIAKHTAICEAMEIVENVREELERVTGWHD